MKERVKIIRDYYGLSQAQFAQRINMSPGFISNIETGRTHVSEKTVDAICKAFLVDKNWMMTGEGEMFVGSEVHNPVDKEEIASRVKTVRKYADLTQEEFGKRIGYSKMQVYSVEKGKVTPSNQFLEKMVGAFGVNASWLFTGKGNMEYDGEKEDGTGMKNQERGLDEQLINWLNERPDVIAELRKRSGRD